MGEQPSLTWTHLIDDRGGGCRRSCGTDREPVDSALATPAEVGRRRVHEKEHRGPYTSAPRATPLFVLELLMLMLMAKRSVRVLVIANDPIPRE